jgi:uncharacterized membrane protein
MTPVKRLWLIAGLIVLSASYAVIVKKDHDLAQLLALGYIAIMLTVLVYIHICGRDKHG